MRKRTCAHIRKNENNSTLCMMNYFKIRNKTTQFESVTGLKLEEFDKLLPVFTEEWRNFYRIHTIEGKKRKGPISSPLKDTKSLPSVAEKLFFILVYLKNYSLQEMLGASFGVSQSQASKWQKVLTPLLNNTLESLNLLPAREGQKVAPILEELGENLCFQDATERLINRPKDDSTQEKFYSGKKKPTL